MYFLNFLYWRGFRLLSRLEGNDYWESVQTDYEDEAIWGTHRLELQAVVEYTRDQNIALVVVIFPSLTDVAGSQDVTAKVANMFRAGGVAVIDLSDYLVGRAPRSMTVNSVDSHPNVALHREVANLILQKLQAGGYVKGSVSGEPRRSEVH